VCKHINIWILNVLNLNYLLILLIGLMNAYPPVSSTLKFCNRSLVYAAPALWKGLPKDLRQFAHHRNLPHLIPLHSPLLHSTNDWRTNSSIYPILFLLLCHHMSANITVYNRSSTLSPWIDLLDFDLAPNEMRSLAITVLIWHSE